MHGSSTKIPNITETDIALLITNTLETSKSVMKMILAMIVNKEKAQNFGVVAKTSLTGKNIFSYLH